MQKQKEIDEVMEMLIEFIHDYSEQEFPELVTTIACLGAIKKGLLSLSGEQLETTNYVLESLSKVSSEIDKLNLTELVRVIRLIKEIKNM